MSTRDSLTAPVSVICCIGAGHVGGPTMAMLAKKCPKIKVTVVDHNPRQIAAWNSSQLPVYEPGLQELVEEVRGLNLFFSNDVEAAIKAAQIIFVCVNTPLKDSGIGAGEAPDLIHWEKTARIIASTANGPKIVVEKSTVPVKTAQSMTKVMQKNCSYPIQMLSNPEFMAEGCAMVDLASPDRVLIGCNQTKEGLEAMEKLIAVYLEWVPRGRIITTDLWSAELTKLTANAFLAQRISSINSISALCEATGADVNEVAHAIGVDSRIGPKQLKAGVGFGGACYGPHLANLIYLCKSLRLHDVAEYWRQVLVMNEWQKRRFTEKMVSIMFNTVAGKRIGILGYAYKKNTEDIRATPAKDVCLALLKERAALAIYDPKVPKDKMMKDLVDYEGMYTVETDVYATCFNAHALAVLTEWDEFKMLDFQRIYENMSKPCFIFDGRNILDHAKLKKIGFGVYAVGVSIDSL